MNVADAGDVVALVKDLRPLFGPRVECFTVSNGARAHAVSPYLTAQETGAAITAGLGMGLVTGGLDPLTAGGGSC